MNVLLTNDDGFDAPGIRVAAKQLLAMGHDVYVVAPDQCCSATSMSVSVGRNVTAERAEFDDGLSGYRIGGTCIDCVKLAMTGALATPQPELLVSGVNYGINVARDMMYSGTVGAAREGAWNGLPAVALSAERSPEGMVYFEQATEVFDQYFDTILGWLATQPASFVNVNVPKVPMQGVRETRVSLDSYFLDGYRQDPDGFRLDGPRSPNETDLNTDLGAVAAGFASVSLVNSHWQDLPRATSLT